MEMEIDKKSAFNSSVSQRGCIGRMINSTRRAWLWPILFKIQVKVVEKRVFLFGLAAVHTRFIDGCREKVSGEGGINIVYLFLEKQSAMCMTVFSILGHTHFGQTETHTHTHTHIDISRTDKHLHPALKKSHIEASLIF